MSTKSISVGLIGLGDMGSGHLECLNSFPNVRIVALCDTNPVRLKTNSAKIYSDYRDLLEDKNVEAVFVSVPNYLHCEIGLATLAARKHLFLEKPLSLNLKEGKKLLQAAKKTKLIFHVGHVYRHSPFFQNMMEWIGSGVIGEPVLLWCHEFRQPFPQRDWFYDRSKSGGTFVEKNCHHFDLFNWATQDQPKQIVAFGGLKVLRPGKEIACSYCPDLSKKIKFNDTLDHGWAMVEYKKGAKANLGLCMFLQPPSRIWRGLEFGVISDSGKMLVSNVDFETMTLYGGATKEEMRTVKNPNQGKWHSGMREEHEVFLAAIQQGKKSIESVVWAYEAIRIGCAAEESAGKNKIIVL